MNKRGQFYLIMALVAIGVIVGITITANTSQKKEYDRISDLGEEIKVESSKVMDYAVSKGQPVGGVLLLLTKAYGDNYKNELNMYFIFGSSSSITIVAYQNSEIFKVNGETLTSTSFTGEPPSTTRTFTNPVSSLPVVVGDSSYSLSLKSFSQTSGVGQNFYFILTKNINGERYVISG